MNINPSIFRAYDVRGIYGRDLTEDVLEKIGNVIGGFLGNKIVLGYDNRKSSPSLRDAFVKGATSSGVNVTDLGLVPRGMVMFWCWKNKLPGAYITASHLTAEWNGIQFMHKNGQGFSEENNMKVRDIVLKEGPEKAGKMGKVKVMDVKEEYVKSLAERVPAPLKPLRVLLDCGNGTAGVVAQEVFRSKGIEADVIFREPDGDFPNRESDLTDETLKKAVSMAGDYDITFAYDGDSDRLALIDSRGRIAGAETIAHIILKELLKKEQGPVVANVECSNIIDRTAAQYSRRIKRVRVGNTFMMQAIYDSSACFGVETSRHFVIPSIFPFDDAIAVSLFATYALSRMDGNFSEIVDKMPKFIKDRVDLECPDDKKFRVVEEIKKKLSREYERVNTMDGVRVDFDKGWILVRASNTSPLIRLTIEAENKKEFEKLKERFSKVVKAEIKSNNNI